MNIDLIKKTGDPLFAADIMTIIAGVNSKADSTAVDGLHAEDVRLGNLINSLTGNTSNIDLTPYLTQSVASSTYQPIGTYLTALPDITWSMVKNKPAFDGYLDAGYYDEGYAEGLHYGYSKLESDARYLGSGYTFQQDFDYDSLENKPVIPSLNGYATENYVNSQGFLKSIGTISYNSLSDKPILFSGSYNDLTDLPDISGGGDVDLSGYLTLTGASNTYQTKGDYVTMAEASELIASYATVDYVNSQGFLKTVSWETVINKPALFSGSYADLIDKPTIVDSYTKIQSDAKYLPTGTTIFSGSYTDLTNKPTIPSVAGLASESFVTTALTGYSVTGHTHSFASLTAKPTTLSGYGITDAVTISQLATKANLSLTVSNKTANYSLILSDNGNLITMNMAIANTVTVPANASIAFPAGSQIIVQQVGTGQTTITAASGVTINSTGAKIKTNVQWSAVTLIKTATNVWSLIGDLA